MPVAAGLLVILLLALGCGAVAQDPTPLPTASPIVPTSTPRPIPLPTPMVAPTPVPDDYSIGEFRRFMGLKRLCTGNEPQWRAWDLAMDWLKDLERFNFKVDSGMYGKHWDRTPDFYEDKRALIMRFYKALEAMERACLD